MGLLDALIYGIRDVFDKTGIQLPRRSRAKFTGGTVTDDPAHDMLLIDTGGVPGGSDTQFQFNDAGEFNGSSGAVYDKSTNKPYLVNGFYAFGTIAGTNKILFSGSPTAARTWTIQDATDTFVGKATTDTLTNKTLTSPNVNGTPVYVGTRFKIYSVVGEVQTASTSQVAVASFAMSDETHVQFDALVTYARRTHVTKAGTWKRAVAYYRTSGGAPTIVGTIDSGIDQETTLADDVTIGVSGNTVQVLVTPADSDGRNWSCEIRIQETQTT